MTLEAATLRRLFQDHALDSVFPADQDASLARFTHQMLELNQVLNLTKWTAPEEVLYQHILDSAFGMPIIKNLGLSPNARWMDLGAGGGFPGALVLAAFPGRSMTFVDAISKKSQALIQCLAAATWSAEVLTQRAEILGQDPRTRESWDGIVARAVADLPVLLEYAIPLLKTGGYLLNWMTLEQIQKVDKAQKALGALKAQIVLKQEYQLPGLSQSRFILLVEKLGTTDARYPRPVGRPSKKPLI